jgi:uncharacterized protein YdaU (DUF1376 family)
MASDLPFMKLWVGDLLKDVLEMGLTDEEFGVYMKLLCVAWERGSIFEDLKQNARWLSCADSRLKKLWPAFSHKWVPNGDGGLVNPKQEEVREEALSKSKGASKSANIRWEKVRRERAEREAAERAEAA